ncbi:MAG: hypothetical protein V1492_01950 [Candidatus Micrarchaeota archaeon]
MNTRRLVLVLLLLALFLPAAQAEESTQQQISTFVADVFGVMTWLPFVALALFVALIFNGTLYSIGKAFNLRELETSAKTEMYQSMATVVFIVFFVIIVGGATVMMNQMISGTVSCGKIVIPTSDFHSAISVAKCKLMDKANSIAELQADMVNNANWYFNLLNLNFNLLGFPVFSGSYVSDLYKAMESARFINTFATNALIALNAQIFFLSYIDANMLSLFLPVGIVLRAIQPTRAIGSLFISIAIGFYLVFPYVFIVTDPGFVKLPPAQPRPAITGGNFCYPTYSSAVAYVNYVVEEEGGAPGSTSSGGLGQQLGRTYTSLLIHPLVALFVTIVSIRYFMYLFGEEAYDILRMVSKVV